MKHRMFVALVALVSLLLTATLPMTAATAEDGDLFWEVKAIPRYMEEEYRVTCISQVIQNDGEDPFIEVFFPVALFWFRMEPEFIAELDGRVLYYVPQSSLDELESDDYEAIHRTWWYNLEDVCNILWDYFKGGLPVVHLIFTEANSVVLEYTLDGVRQASAWQRLDDEEPFWRINAGRVEVSGTVVAELLKQLLR